MIPFPPLNKSKEIKYDSSSASMENSSIPRSATMETKEKFDSFLKCALKKSSPENCTKRKEKLTDKKPDEAIQDLLHVTILKDTSEQENREFILNKFFENNTGVDTISSLGNNKRGPVPKPRTKIRPPKLETPTLSSPSSNETFKVTAPKMVVATQENFTRDNRERIENAGDLLSPVSSTGTFRVAVPKILKKPGEDEQLNERINDIAEKNNIPEAGDIIIHDSSSSKENASKIIQVEVKNYKNNSNTDELESNIGSQISEDSKMKRRKNFEPDNETMLDSEIANQNLNDKVQIDKVIQIIIHRTDKLQLNSLVIHPVVKIHIVDMNTGNYYSKKHKRRSVVYYYDDNLDYISPIMTHPYNLREQRSLLPKWEESILINEDFEYLVGERENIIIFFEILDFIACSATNDKTKGWYEIAFAFLKIQGKKGALNLEKMMRLQLYYCSPKKDNLKQCSVWDTWRKKKLTKYPSTLYITIKSVKIKEKITTGLRSKDALQKEVGTEHTDIEKYENVKKNSVIRSLLNTIEKGEEWSKNLKDTTKLPNKCVAQFDTEEGCFALKFSHNGLFLACALRIENIYSLVIFSVISFEEICHFPGHQGIIYSICWSPDDYLIIAASADSSVSVWDVSKVCFLQILPHPSFVYASDIGSTFIVTGCYDTVVRIWKHEDFVDKFVLSQELEGHEGYITCVRFNKSYDNIFSSDSDGGIIEWCFESNNWISQRKITIPDLKGIIINQVELIGKGKRLLVHSRDSILRILDLATLIVMYWLQGGLNRRFHTSCSVSSCGHYIIAGSENSLVNIWKVKNGKYVGNLVPYENKSVTIQALEFHPKDNMLAVGHFGNDLPVLLFGFDGTDANEIDSKTAQKNEPDSSSRVLGNLEHEIRLKSNFSNLDYKNVLNKFDKLMIGQLKN